MYKWIQKCEGQVKITIHICILIQKVKSWNIINKHTQHFCNLNSMLLFASMLTKELNKIQRYWIRFFKDLILILINNLEMIYGCSYQNIHILWLLTVPFSNHKGPNHLQIKMYTNTPRPSTQKLFYFLR